MNFCLTSLPKLLSRPLIPYQICTIVIKTKFPPKFRPVTKKSARAYRCIFYNHLCWCRKSRLWRNPCISCRKRFYSSRHKREAACNIELSISSLIWILHRKFLSLKVCCKNFHAFFSAPQKFPRMLNKKNISEPTNSLRLPQSFTKISTHKWGRWEGIYTHFSQIDLRPTCEIFQTGPKKF